MKYIFPLLFLLAPLCRAQVFTGSTGAIISNGGQETLFNVSVSGLPSKIDSTFGLLEVNLNITHPAVEELHIVLKSPWGIEVDLSGVAGIKGANFTNTTFDSNHNTSITLGTAPYTGVFRPVGYLGRFNSGKSPNGAWTLEVKDFVLANSGSVIGWSIKFGSNPPKAVVLASSNLPIVFLNTNNQQLSDLDIPATLGIVNNVGGRNFVTDPKNGYNGKCVAHLRGSSSKMFEKQNIKIELRDNTGAMDLEYPLIQMPPESDWVLTAFYNDKSLLRNPLTHHLFSKMGRYAPRFRYVELVLNGEYFGIYILMEQPKRGQDRVNINKLNTYDNAYPAITGGYIIQINRSDDPGWPSLMPGISSTAAKFYYQYNYPKPEEITAQQKSYIKAVMDSFETVMASPSFSDPKTGFRKFINEESFIDFMIINELSKNVDAYKLSTYLYKHNVIDGGKINIGPTWDYDLAWHNSDFGNAWNELYWQFEQSNNDYAIPTWWTNFMKDPAFKDKLYCRYHTFRKYQLSNNEIYQFIDGTTAMLAEASVRNFKQFPVIGAKLYGNPQFPQQDMTYAKEIQDLKDWVFRRGDWLDKNIPGFCQNVSVDEINGAGQGLNVFPNPFSGQLKLTYSLDTDLEQVGIRLFDITGARVFAEELGKRPAGTNQYVLDCADLPPGTYVLELSVKDRKAFRKVVKTPAH